MPSRAEIVSFDDSPPPPGADPWAPGTAPAIGIEVTDPDPAWPRQYDDLAGRIREALGWRVLQIESMQRSGAGAASAARDAHAAAGRPRRANNCHRS